jgi:hypothetical protein
MVYVENNYISYFHKYNLPSHNIGGYYKDTNRQGHNIWAVMTGTWLKTESDPYYRHYKHFISGVSNDWIIVLTITLKANHHVTKLSTGGTAT